MSRENLDDIDVSQLLAHFQEITGIEDQARSLAILEDHSWNLEAAVQDALNEKDGVRTVFREPRTYSTFPEPESSPPSLVRHSPSGPISPPTRVGQGTVATRTWEWLLNLAFFPVRFLVTTAADLLQFIFHLAFGYQPTPARNPIGDVHQFVTGFEAEFGSAHPRFLSCSYSQALEQARQQLKFLLVYLHSPGHQDTAEFCSKILTNKEFIEFVSANCITWAVGVNTEEGVRVSYILRENTYPFLALIVLKQSRMVVVERVEGLLPLRELIARLAVGVRMNEAELVVERSERTRRSVDQSIRDEQDRAYQASLMADREKERKRQEELRKESTGGDRQEQKKENEETVTKRSHRASLIPPEPLPTDPDVIHVVIRVPTGERLERRFRGSDKLEGVYSFALSCRDVSHDFTLMSNFPRKELCCTPDGGPLLSELGLGTKCALYIKDDSE